MNKPFQVFRRKDAKLKFADNAVGGSMLDRIVDETFSDQMGAGMFRVHRAPNTVALPYDEVAICLEGTLKLTVGGVTNNLEVGDFAWIPKGTDITFDGENAIAFYGVYPVDWRARAEKDAGS
jgi:ethanolamine utilization protein EutQ (cupin superfamily)